MFYTSRLGYCINGKTKNIEFPNTHISDAECVDFSWLRLWEYLVDPAWSQYTVKESRLLWRSVPELFGKNYLISSPLICHVAGLSLVLLQCLDFTRSLGTFEYYSYVDVPKTDNIFPKTPSWGQTVLYENINAPLETSCPEMDSRRVLAWQSVRIFCQGCLFMKCIFYMVCLGAIEKCPAGRVDFS